MKKGQKQFKNAREMFRYEAERVSQKRKEKLKEELKATIRTCVAFGMGVLSGKLLRFLFSLK